MDHGEPKISGKSKDENRTLNYENRILKYENRILKYENRILKYKVRILKRTKFVFKGAIWLKLSILGQREEFGLDGGQEVSGNNERCRTGGHGDNRDGF